MSDLRESNALNSAYFGDSFDSTILTYSYNEDDFSFIARLDDQSLMDKYLQSLWEKNKFQGNYRYELDDLRTKYLPGKYNFIIQLNVQRAINRRKPQAITDVIMMFDPEKFHFGKVCEREIMFNMDPLHWEISEKDKHVLLINVSPLEFCHSLLVPCIEKCFPQVLNFKGLKLAVECMLLSQNSSFRIGYNSLGGFASVNHLHFHVYYLKYKLFLEHAPTNHLVGPCYELVDFPSQGFVFEILKKEDISDVIRSIQKLIDVLLVRKIAHNVFLTRATPLSELNPDAKELCSLRIYVWARETYFGVKDDTSFNVAVCELAGHIPIKDKESYENITEDKIATLLNIACHETFISIKEEVIKLFQE